MLGQFLGAEVTFDPDYNVMKFGNRKPISVKRAPAWPFLGTSELCWYPTVSDNQGAGVIEGVYTDYVVEHLVAEEL